MVMGWFSMESSSLQIMKAIIVGAKESAAAPAAANMPSLADVPQ